MAAHPERGGCHFHPARPRYRDGVCKQCHQQLFPLKTERPVFQMNPKTKHERNALTAQGRCFVCSEENSLQTPEEKSMRVCLRCWLPFPLPRYWEDFEEGYDPDAMPYTLNDRDGVIHVLTEENSAKPCQRCGQDNRHKSPFRFDMPRNGGTTHPRFVQVDLECSCIRLFLELEIPQLQKWFVWRVYDLIMHADEIPPWTSDYFLTLMEIMAQQGEDSIDRLNNAWTDKRAEFRENPDHGGLRVIFETWPNIQAMVMAFQDDRPPKPSKRK